MERAEQKSIQTTVRPCEHDLPPIAPEENAWLMSSRRPEQTTCVHRQQYSLQEYGDLARGIIKGVIDAEAQFIEFLAQPNAVSDALVGIGPALDNAVNYYGNHLLKGTTTQIACDANEAKAAIKAGLSTYSSMLPERRGELIGWFGFQTMLAEIGGNIATKPLRAGAEAFRTPSELAAKDYSHLPENLQEIMQSVETVLEKTATTERSGIKVMNLTASAEHAAHVQNIIESLSPELHNLIESSRLKFKTVNTLNDILLDKENVRGLIRLDQGAVYISDKFVRRAN